MRKTEARDRPTILFFLEGRDVPSSRFRVRQFDEKLQAEGVQSRFLYTHPSKYLWCPRMFRQTPLYLAVAGFQLIWIVFTRCIQILMYARSYRIIFLQRDLLYRVNYPFLEQFLFWYTRDLRERGKLRIIFDVDDAIYLDKRGIETKGLKKKFQAIMPHCDLVIVGNAHLESYFSKLARCVLIPTVIDTSRFVRTKDVASFPNLTLVWTGTSSNLVYLNELVPVLSELSGRHAFELCVICNEPPRELLSCENLRVRYVPWSKEIEVSELAKAHIGLMPLRDDAWSAGKCGFKLLQYLSLELAAVASPVGVNSEIIVHGESGFLASNETQWFEALEVLLSSPDKWKEFGQKGREKVEARYSLEHWGAKWVEHVLG